MKTEGHFKPAWWLKNAHVQTIFPTFLRRLQRPIVREERFELPDGDFVDLAWAETGIAPDAPLVIFLHGLGGDVNSKYIVGLLHAVNQRGWRGVLMHFRGAGREPNRLARAYHSGDTADLDYFLRILHEREPQTKKAVVGFSLGGNVLLKWLGEQGQQSLIHGAAAVSVPFQLGLVADKINRGFSRFYQNYLLKRLRQVFNRKLEHLAKPIPESLRRLNDCQCFWTFDEYITAPLNGYAHVHDYYRESSSRQFLIDIATPTLIIHAKDDPFMVPAVIPRAEELSKDIVLEVSEHGGHVGFISGQIPGRPIYWLDERIPQFLHHFLS